MRIHAIFVQFLTFLLLFGLFYRYGHVIKGITFRLCIDPNVNSLVGEFALNFTRAKALVKFSANFPTRELTLGSMHSLNVMPLRSHSAKNSQFFAFRSIFGCSKMDRNAKN